MAGRTITRAPLFSVSEPQPDFQCDGMASDVIGDAAVDAQGHAELPVRADLVDEIAAINIQAAQEACIN